MSINTFLKWFFGWMSNMKLDFRKEIDLVCGYNPQILVCDGTHIGVSNTYSWTNQLHSQIQMTSKKQSIRDSIESY